MRGCTEDAAEPFEIEGFALARCPLTYVGAAEHLRLEAFAEYKAGYLPGSGGWLDQPMKFSAIMRLIDRYVEKYKEESHGERKH